MENPIEIVPVQEFAKRKLKEFIAQCSRRDGGKFKIEAIQSDAAGNFNFMRGSVFIEHENGSNQNLNVFWDINGACQVNSLLKTPQGNITVPARNFDLVLEQPIEEFNRSMK